MAKTRRRRRNPTGTLLINPRRGSSKAKRTKRSKRAVSLASLFSRAAKSNPRRRRSGSKRTRTRGRSRANPRRRVSRGRGRRRNPLMVNPRRRRSSKRRSSRRRNPLMVNPRRRGRKGRRRNPLMVNPRRRRGSKGRKRNPIMINRGRGRRGSRRRNPGAIVRMGKGYLGKAQGLARKIPLIGGILSAAVGGVGSALLGAIGVLPIDYAMPYVAQYIPPWARPFAYSVGGLILAGVVKAIPVRVPYKDQIAVGLMFAGGAVDSYRARRGTSLSLAGDMDGEYGFDDLGELEGDLGDSGEQFAAIEYGDTDLGDAEYSGDDLSADEIATAELGRRAWRKKYRARPKKQSGSPSDHGAGLPGERWGWLIYWIGFDNFQLLASKPENERKAIIDQMRREAFQLSRKLLGQSLDTSVQQAETAGLLALG